MNAAAQNPIINEGSADPSLKVFGGRVYVYGSHDFSPNNTTWIMKDWKVFSSADLVTWTDHGVVLDDNSLPWRGVTDEDWAPDAIAFNNKYYFYFPLGNGTIGVAAGSSPAGPFTDILGGPLVTYQTTPAFNIDPMAFQDTDGKRYLIWGNGGAYVAQLNDDMKSFAAGPKKITITGAPSYEEGPFAWMHDGKYYLLYSACGAGCSDHLDYAVGTSIGGPFTYRGTIIGHGKRGNEHGSVFEYNQQWYVAYHDLYPTDYYRKTKLEFIHYTSNGDIPQVYPTDYGVGRYDGSKRIEAENYFEKSADVTYEDCSDTGNGFDVTTMGNGGWLYFPKVDFGRGTGSLQARVLSSSGANGFEIRLGTIDGALVGTGNVLGSGQTWTTVTASFNCNAIGVSDIYLVFNGSAVTPLKVNWVQFGASLGGGPTCELTKGDAGGAAEQTDAGSVVDSGPLARDATLASAEDGGGGSSGSGDARASASSGTSAPSDASASGSPSASLGSAGSSEFSGSAAASGAIGAVASGGQAGPGQSDGDVNTGSQPVAPAPSGCTYGIGVARDQAFDSEAFLAACALGIGLRKRRKR